MVNIPFTCRDVNERRRTFGGDYSLKPGRIDGKGFSREILLLICVCAGLVVLTVIAYEPIRHNGFINFDDPRYVTENPHIKGGITGKSLAWAFGRSYANNWHPVTWVSHMLDYELFGLRPFGHHIVSLLLHIFNTLLLFGVLKKMTGAVWRSGFVAAAFALHPLHVESVAWVSERKDVLSAFFCLLTIWAYACYAERRGFFRYVLVAVFLVLGLMSKPMLVTVPFVLLLLDYWPLGRVSWRGGIGEGGAVAVAGGVESVWRLILEKIPLFVLVGVSCVITYVVQQSSGAVKTWESYPLGMRLSNAAVSYCGYIVKMVYPTSLAVLYPYPVNGPAVWNVLVCCAVLVGISGLVIYAARRRRYPAVGWFWYLGTLVPVIGLVQVGVQAMADRYTYLPSIGIFIIVSWGIAELTNRWRFRTAIVTAASCVLIAGMVVRTRRQVGYWKDSVTLFEHTLWVTENNAPIENNYASTLCKQGRFDQAIEHFRKCLQINPRHANAHYNLGLVLAQKNELEGAVVHLRRSLELNPNSAHTLINLAGVLLMRAGGGSGDGSEAVRLARRACELTNYGNPQMLSILAEAYAKTGNFEAAVGVLEKAKGLYLARGKKKEAQQMAERQQRYKAKQLNKSN